MEYQFYLDTLSGGFKANFSLEHQVFGRWLENEIGKDKVKLKQLLKQLSMLSNEQSLQVSGIEYSLYVNQGEVEVLLNSVLTDSELPEYIAMQDLQFETVEKAECGIEDFIELLTDWCDFIG
jgi:uncharacterized protein YacL (UPF0231 family)